MTTGRYGSKLDSASGTTPREGITTTESGRTLPSAARSRMPR